MAKSIPSFDGYTVNEVCEIIKMEMIMQIKHDDVRVADGLNKVIEFIDYQLKNKWDKE